MDGTPRQRKEAKLAGLSVSQWDTLEQAESQLKADFVYPLKAFSPGSYGWFAPQRHDAAPVISTHQTCKSLCKIGLLEYRVLDQRTNYTAYRITKLGRKVVKQNQEVQS